MLIIGHQLQQSVAPATSMRQFQWIHEINFCYYKQTAATQTQATSLRCIPTTLQAAQGTVISNFDYTCFIGTYYITQRPRINANQQKVFFLVLSSLKATATVFLAHNLKNILKSKLP